MVAAKKKPVAVGVAKDIEGARAAISKHPADADLMGAIHGVSVEESYAIQAEVLAESQSPRKVIEDRLIAANENLADLQITRGIATQFIEQLKKHKLGLVVQASDFGPDPLGRYAKLGTVLIPVTNQWAAAIAEQFESGQHALNQEIHEAQETINGYQADLETYDAAQAKVDEIKATQEEIQAVADELGIDLTEENQTNAS